MLEITKETEIKLFVKYMTDINQVFKTRVKDKEEDVIGPNHTKYTIKSGKVISFNSTCTTNVSSTLEYTAKQDFFKEALNSSNLLVNGDGLYKFFTQYGKCVNKVVIDPSGILFETTVPQVTYLIESFEKTTHDLDTWVSIKTEGSGKFMDRQHLVDTFDLTDENVSEILNAKGVHIVKLPDVTLRLTKKTIFGLGAKKKTVKKEQITLYSKVSIEVYATDFNNIYAIKINVNNHDIGKMSFNNFFAVVTYEDKKKQ